MAAILYVQVNSQRVHGSRSKGSPVVSAVQTTKLCRLISTWCQFPQPLPEQGECLSFSNLNCIAYLTLVYAVSEALVFTEVAAKLLVAMNQETRNIMDVSLCQKDTKREAGPELLVWGNLRKHRSFYFGSVVGQVHENVFMKEKICRRARL